MITIRKFHIFFFSFMATFIKRSLRNKIDNIRFQLHYTVFVSFDTLSWQCSSSESKNFIFLSDLHEKSQCYCIFLLIQVFFCVCVRWKSNRWKCFQNNQINKIFRMLNFYLRVLTNFVNLLNGITLQELSKSIWQFGK